MKCTVIMQRAFALLILFAAFSSVPVRLYSQTILTLTDGPDNYNLASHLDYLADKTKSLAIKEVSSPKMGPRFTRHAEKSLNFGYTDSYYWFRIIAKNESKKTDKWVLVIDWDAFHKAELYCPDGKGGYTVQSQGRAYPFVRPIKHRHPLFVLEIPRNQTGTCYLKVINTLMRVPLSLYPDHAFYRIDHDNQFYYGIYYGIMAVMAIFNLILFVFLKDENYMYLVAFIVSWVLNQMCINGFAHEYLWPGAIIWSRISEMIFTGLVDFTGILFTAKFLSTKKRFPRLHWVILIVMFLSVLQIIHGAITPYIGKTVQLIMQPIHVSIILITVILAIVSSAIAYAKKYRESRFFLISWVSFLAGTILYILSIVGLIPKNLFTENSMQVGSALIVVLLSVALADRYRLIRLEKEVAEQTNIQRTEFFTNLSHEIKTPLTLISNYMDQYVSRHGTSDELGVVKRNIEKLLSDMMNFFDVLKFERGIGTYDHGIISDLSDIVRQKIDLFISMGHKQSISITSDIENRMYVKADPLAIERIINNLMENAIRYNRHGGSIKVSLKSEGTGMLLSIKDAGIGIEKDQLQNIFEPYFQIAHKKRNIQGIGMGLSLVKGIVDSIGGTIEVQSEPGQGSTFTIALKRYELREGDSVNREVLAVRPADTLPYLRDIPKGGSGAAGLRRVLIVEDNLDLLRLMQNRLSEQYDVTTARNGREALEKLSAIGLPDLIISDIMMDEMDGYEFFDRLMKEDTYQDIPFIFVTARSQTDEKIEGLRRGAIDYIYKPFVMDELVSKIYSIFRYQDLRKAVFEKDKFTSLGMLLGGISHEIFNPLSGITGPLDNLKNLVEASDLKNDKKVWKYFGNIKESAEKIEKIIKNIRTLYSNNPLDKEEIDMREIINTVAEGFQKDYDQRVRFIINAEKGGAIRGNRDAVMRILHNLISNAVDSIEGPGSVTISARQSDGATLLTVADTGRGIAPENIDRIFDAFYTSKAAGQGMGLGLNIVKNLVMKLNWKIEVDSKPGKGAAFTISIKGE